MADTFDTPPSIPLYRPIPVLEVADAPPRIPEVLPADRETDAPLEVLPADVPTLVEPLPHPAARAFAIAWRSVRAVASMLEWIFGVAVLMIGLAVLAALPLLQFLSLGYLLESGGRVARTGRLRDGFIGVRRAARLGGVVLGCWLMLLPARFVAGLAYSAQIIDPDGRQAAGWRIGLFVLIGLTAGHIGMACARGGRLRYFFWPFNFIWVLLRLARGGYYTESRDAVWDAFVSLRLPYYFSLGFRGFIGALAWLALPVTMLALGRVNTPIAPLLGFQGALLLALVLVYLPFMQMRLAMTNRLSAAFDVMAARKDFRRAPYAFAFAYFITLLFALPLYLLKIEMVPREAAWLPSLVFIAFIFPARLLTGWALGRAVHRQTPRHWFFRWTARLTFLPAAAFYVLIVYFTQFTSWNGVWSLYEQHAFLVPVPFFGM
ncbi:MAG TPA: hypothetical protein VN688_05820 [Gemmataceae bacterium]|nr:hypothetical protein [Gemmataceae bacterium]